MAAQSKLTYRTLRLATIALGLACFHAYAQGAGPGNGRVTTVGRTGGGGNSRISTFTARQGSTKSGVESFAGQRVRVSKSSTVAGGRRTTSKSTSDVALAVARTQQRMAAKPAPVLRVKNGAPSPEAPVSDPVLRAALAKPEARKTDGIRNVFALGNAPTVADLIADSAMGAAPRAGGNSH